MNICYVLGGFSSGGIGRVVSILANEQCNREKYHVHAVTLFKPQKEDIYKLDKKINREFLIENQSSVRRVLPKAVFRLRKYIKENNIDIVIACGNVFYPIVVLASIGISRTICWEHSNIFNTNDNMGQTALRWFASKFSNEVVTLTECDKNAWMKKFRTKRIRRIYNPIDNKLYKYTSQYDVHSNKIVSVGRFGYQKYFETIPQIAMKLDNYLKDWEWHIFGDGETRAKITKQIEELGLSNKVIFEGQVDNIYERYKEFSLMVMTSRYEGFPMSLLEGAANFLPLISFDVKTGPDEIIEDNQNGFLITFDDIDDFAKKIGKLLLDDSLRKKMSNKSKEKAEQFKVDNIVEEWDRLLKELKYEP